MVRKKKENGVKMKYEDTKRRKRKCIIQLDGEKFGTFTKLFVPWRYEILLSINRHVEDTFSSHVILLYTNTCIVDRYFHIETNALILYLITYDFFPFLLHISFFI